VKLSFALVELNALKKGYIEYLIFRAITLQKKMLNLSNFRTITFYYFTCFDVSC
jgi:hypothetical protein